MALQVAISCKVNVVFTRVDNVFFQNPFEHDLGRLIKSKRYDYLYQPNDPAWNPREDQCLHGNPRDEANTGFYYFSHKSEMYKTIAKSTLGRCQDPNNNLDDQTLFWQEFWNVKRNITGIGNSDSSSIPSSSTLTRNDTTFRHCGLSEYENPIFDPKDQTEGNNNGAFNYCCLDPYYYPIGKHKQKRGPSNNDPITYHANYAWTYGKKVQKLVYARPDGYGWNMSRFEDGIGGILNIEDDENKN